MDYFVLRFDHSYRKEDFRALSKLAGKTTRKWSSQCFQRHCLWSQA